MFSLIWYEVIIDLKCHILAIFDVNEGKNLSFATLYIRRLQDPSEGSSCQLFLWLSRDTGYAWALAYGSYQKKHQSRTPWPITIIHSTDWHSGRYGLCTRLWNYVWIHIACLISHLERKLLSGGVNDFEYCFLKNRFYRKRKTLIRGDALYPRVTLRFSILSCPFTDIY